MLESAKYIPKFGTQVRAYSIVDADPGVHLTMLAITTCTAHEFDYSIWVYSEIGANTVSAINRRAESSQCRLPDHPFPPLAWGKGPGIEGLPRILNAPFDFSDLRNRLKTAILDSR